MATVYLLWHTRELEDGHDEDKLVGVYSNAAMAKAAQQRKLQYPGFRDFPDGFEISKYTVDKDSWTEGFTLPHDLPSWLEVLPDGALWNPKLKRRYELESEEVLKPQRPLPELRIVGGGKKDGAVE
ncbi:MAG: hypothetical protein JWN71_4179 [Xanthobacteraceae bacterium]|nr:hypothetical protein [Xanthobacteraceae bacterium]